MALSARKVIFQARRKVLISLPVIHRESVSKWETLSQTHTLPVRNINKIYRLFLCIHTLMYIHI